MQITIVRLLHTPARVSAPLRPYAVTHRNRPGFIERQDGSWLSLSVQPCRQTKAKARRRLWDWLSRIANNRH